MFLDFIVTPDPPGPHHPPPKAFFISPVPTNNHTPAQKKKKLHSVTQAAKEGQRKGRRQGSQYSLHSGGRRPDTGPRPRVHHRAIAPCDHASHHPHVRERRPSVPPVPRRHP